MVKKITGNAGEVFSIKSNDKIRYLLRADIWSYYFLGVYWVYSKRSMIRTRQDAKDWVYRKKLHERTQRNEKHWVHKEKIAKKTQLNEKDWMYEKRNVLYTQCRGKRWV